MNIRKPRPAIDWEDARRQLARLDEAVEGALRPSPDKVRQILDERARRLARPPQVEQASAGLLEVVTFTLAGETYAIESRFVREMVRVADLTPVPGTPATVAGVTNVRGVIVDVLDLRGVFGLLPKGSAALSRMLILGTERDEFGILVEEVREVMTLAKEEFLKLPEAAPGPARDYLAGVTRDALLLIDGSALLNDTKLVVDQNEKPARRTDG